MNSKCTARGVYKNLKDSPYFEYVFLGDEGDALLKFSSAKKKQMYEKRAKEALRKANELLDNLQAITGVRYCPKTLEEDTKLFTYKIMEHK